LINQELHKQPLALDTVAHRSLRLQGKLSAASRLAEFTSYMVTLSEFNEAAREFPIVWVNADVDDGKQQVAPIALFGLTRGENLFVANNLWTGAYLPAAFRAYPFTLARVQDSEQWAVVMDRSWEGFSETEGDRLFDDLGQPSQMLKDVHQFVQDIEVDIERTRLAGLRLMELKLLSPMRFDATLPDGQKLSLDGFLTIDEKRFGELTDAELGELHRNGLLGLIHVHRLSLGNMRRLIERRLNAAAAAA